MGEYINSYTERLKDAKNIIFRGAPGTGKTYLAQQIAANLVSNGRTADIKKLTLEEANQVGFVQFHPSYDYTDFVEGLRPSTADEGLGFKLQAGTFKEFCERAKNNAIDHDSEESIKENLPYIFIIDEINRGEISKIFGELFFSIDPGYRGIKGGVLTQYSNLHDDVDEKFYIPENVYVIGTMNDIDRSVDTFDFAMRRRFTFLEVTAEESAEHMDLKSDVKKQMTKINNSIVTSGGLTEDYQIGASYFVDQDQPEEDENNAPLWDSKIYPLLKDYFRGEHQAKEKLDSLKKSYFNFKDEENKIDESDSEG